MKTLEVRLPDRSYPIYIGESVLADIDLYHLKPEQRVLIVTNVTIAPFYLEHIKKVLEKNGIRVDTLIVDDGEQFKNEKTWLHILTTMLEQHHTRKSTLIALGGGVIGDVTGFAASCYQRGINFIQIPTTLLSQVDSSVGGKTAINHALGKNMIGTFYQPKSVIIDILTLKTLHPKEFSAGLAEVIKYGIILDAEFFEWLEQNINDLIALKSDALQYCIYKCCELKAKIVAEDETEQGRRVILNLGHTFGHAIEAEMGYGNWLHGESVAIGMIMAANTARLLGKFDPTDVDRIIHLLVKANLPTHKPTTMSIESYIPHMLRDKKVMTNEIRLVLPTKIGSADVFDLIDTECIKSAISVTN